MLLLKRANELLAEHKLREAEFMFKSVLKQSPENGPALFGLGRICMRLEQYDNAIYYLKRACEHLPKMLDPLFALADAFIAVGSPVDAKTVLEYTLSVAKHNAQAHYQLGQFYLDYGFVEQAERVFREGINCPHGTVTGFMLYELAQISALNELEGYIKLLEQLETESETPRLKVVLYYALAKCHERLDNLKQAEDYYQQANETQLTLAEFKTEQMLPLFDSIKKWCNKAFFDKPSDKVKTTFTPVFIVGLPRTGSTLLEQMLIQHPEVGTMGENTVISDKIVPYLCQRNEAQFPNCLHTLSNTMLDHCRGLYVDEIKRQRVAESVVINKLPANFQNIGLIHKLFPEARIIHLTRNLKATAWSVYSNHFAANEPYFCSMTEFALYAQAEQDLMSHFKQFLKHDIFTLSYEQLVAEPEKQIKRCLNFLYLKYDPECLLFYKSKKPVHTLSKSQVRKPVNKTGLEKWQRHADFIAEQLPDPEPMPEEGSEQTTQVSP